MRHRGDTRDAIVRAAASLLAEGGTGAVTTRGVAHAAGVQAPTIYRLFGDKDGLIDAVAEHVMATYVAGTGAVADDAARTDVDPAADLHEGWRLHVEFGLTHPTLFTILADPRRERSSPAGLGGLRVLHSRVRRAAEAGALRVSEDRAVELIRAVGTGVILMLLAAPPEHRVTDLAETAWEAVARTILADRPAVPADDAVAAAVTFRTVVPRLPGLSDAERTLMREWLDRAVDGTPPG